MDAMLAGVGRQIAHTAQQGVILAQGQPVDVAVVKEAQKVVRLQAALAQSLGQHVPGMVGTHHHGA